jgi:DNA polymerase-3 subunit delta'
VARLLDFVLGHQDVIKKMVDSFEAGKPGQTFLFVGPSGVGKKLTAIGLAQALMCPQSPRGCGRCPSCFRVAQPSHAHEGLRIISPNGANIKIEQAKEILEFLSLKSLGGNRVIIIDQANLLNPQTANALLKTLEEPPEGTFFFLIAPSVAGIMPTIRSRSRIVQFKPLTMEELGKRVKAPTWALRSAGGSFEKLAQLQDGPELELREKSVEILNVFMQDPNFLLNEMWRTEFKDRQQGIRLLSYWVSFFRDAIVFQEGAKAQVTNLDQAALIKTLAEQTRERLLKLIQKGLQAEQALGANRDSQLVMEEYFITSQDLV